VKLLVSVPVPALPLPLKVRVSEVGMGVAGKQISHLLADPMFEPGRLHILYSLWVWNI